MVRCRNSQRQRTNRYITRGDTASTSSGGACARNVGKMAYMRWARRKGAQADDAVVDLRDDETIDLREDADDASDYHCMTVHLNLAPVRDESTDQWEQAASLFSYSADIDLRSADLRREGLEPGRVSAAAFEPWPDGDDDIQR